MAPAHTFESPMTISACLSSSACSGLVEDDHGKAGEDTRDQEEDRNELGVPERVDLALGHQIEGTQTGLVESGERDAEDHGSQGHGSQDLPDPPPAQPLGNGRRNGRRELDEFGEHVEHEVPRNEEQHGAEPERVADDRVDDVPGAAEIQEQRAGVEDVRKQAIEHRDAHDGVVLLLSHDVDHERDHISASSERNAGDHVKADPESPWVLLREVGDGTQSLGEPDHQEDRTQQDDGDRDDVEDRELLSLGLDLGLQEGQQAPRLTRCCGH
jgi:hypothetical protein